MKKKKLLYLSQVFPYPADGGGKIKTLNSLKTLAKEFDVFAIFVSEKKPSKSDLNHLKKMGISKIKVFFNKDILRSVKDDYLNLIKNFLKLTPHYVFQYTHRNAFEYISKTIKSFRPDIIHVDHINIAQYLPKEKNEIWILEHHNLEFYLLWTRFLHSSRLTRKMYLLIETTLTYLFESRMLGRFDHIFTISHQEVIRTKRFFKIKSIASQPLVYPITKLKKIKSKVPYILFIGNICWPPNEDAIEWFITKMFPQILQRVPNAELHVIGKNNPNVTRRLPKNNQIFLHGYKKNLNKYLQTADIFVLPFRMGGGVRIKCLTALSAGIPIVSTELGIEGLKLIKDKHYLAANDENKFVNQVINLLKSNLLSTKMSKNQIKYLKENHSQKENNKWLKIYKEII